MLDREYIFEAMRNARLLSLVSRGTPFGLSRKGGVRPNVTTGGSYSPEATAVFSRMPDSMSTGLKNAIATWVDSQVAAGNYDKIIDYVRLDLNTQANSLKGFKGNFNPTLQGGAYWVPFTGCATEVSADYINSDFIPNNYAAFGLSDAGWGVGVRVNETTGSGSSALSGALNAGSNSLTVNQGGSGGTTLSFAMNSATLSTSAVDNVFNNHTYYGVDRVNGTQQRLIVDGVAVATAAANVAASKTAVAIHIGGRNNAGTHQLPVFGTYRYYVAYQAVGFDLASFHAANVVLNEAIDALFIVPLALDFGQSNVGYADTAILFGETSYVEYPTGSKGYSKPEYNTVTDNGSWKRLRIGTGQQAANGRFGANASLATEVFNNNGYPLHYVRASFDGTTLYPRAGTPPDDWEIGDDTECYEIVVKGYFIPAITKTQTYYPNTTIKVFLMWQLGESEGAESANYLTRFTALIDNLRTRHAMLATAPLIITKLYYSLSADETTVNNALSTYVSTEDDAYLIDPASQVTYPRRIDLPLALREEYPVTEGLDYDNHDSHEFQIKKGQLAYNKLIEIGYL